MLSAAQPGPDPLRAPSLARHPRGLYTLFFTEMWERMGYYGMRALLVLFMVDTAAHGGLGLPDETATAIYGLFTSAVYLAALPGGWLGDRWLGTQRAVWSGGLLLAAGYLLMAFPHRETFFLGLLVVVLGSGLLKPNISATVALIYPEGGARRDAGFTLFYMGVNLGAALGPLLCSALAMTFGWHAGFGVAGAGMLLGLVQFWFTRRWLGEAGRPPNSQKIGTQPLRFAALAGTATALASLALLGRWIPFDPVRCARWAALVILAVALIYFAGMLVFAGLDAAERLRLVVIGILFLAAAVFWAGFEQAGSSLNLFAERHTERMAGWLGREIPAGWFQSLGAIFVILLAPAVAALWVWLARYRQNPPAPAKFALGLLLLAGGFVVMALAAKSVAQGQKVLPVWLVATYLLHSLGELCLSPVGLSSVTQLAPTRLAGQMLGIWFLATSLGNILAGLMAGWFKADALAMMPTHFLIIAAGAGSVGLLLALLIRPIEKLTRGTR